MDRKLLLGMEKYLYILGLFLCINAHAHADDHGIEAKLTPFASSYRSCSRPKAVLLSNGAVGNPIKVKLRRCLERWEGGK